MGCFFSFPYGLLPLFNDFLSKTANEFGRLYHTSLEWEHRHWYSPKHTRITLLNAFQTPQHSQWKWTICIPYCTKFYIESHLGLDKHERMTKIMCSFHSVSKFKFYLYMCCIWNLAVWQFLWNQFKMNSCNTVIFAWLSILNLDTSGDQKHKCL